MKFLRVVGARPQFMQAAVLNKELVKRGHQEILVHTGQHYDDNMSTIFFKQLEIASPDINLGVSSGTHGEQTGRMLADLDEVITANQPVALIVDGDTNSTLAGALAAAKLHIPVVHVESGLRSYDRHMPEEINRIIADHIGDLLCAPTLTAMSNLEKEGLSSRAVLTGDLMYDCFLAFKAKANRKILADLGATPDNYILATVHRQENTLEVNKLKNILTALNQLPYKVLFPIHPRTYKVLENDSINLEVSYKNICFISPVGYLEMLALENDANCIFTDSGGVQREAYFSKVPSVILRETTEWKEQIDTNWSILGGSETSRIIAAYEIIMKATRKDLSIYGDGHAAVKIVTAIENLVK